MDAFSPAAPLTPRDKVSSLEVDTAVAAAAVIGALLISAFSAPMTRGRLKIRHLNATKSLGRMASAEWGAFGSEWFPQLVDPKRESSDPATGRSRRFAPPRQI